MIPVIEALQKAIDNNRIKTDDIDLISYASDAGFYSLTPKVIVQPCSDQEIQQIFKIATEHKEAVVFRAGGTSLSGQTITDGILVDLSRYWDKIAYKADTNTIQFQPGITGAMVNKYLQPYGKKIGPDPSSISAAMMGGILSNNSSGMCCGVKYNSYHTLSHVSFILPSGHAYNTSVKTDSNRFQNEQPALYNTIQSLKSRIHNNQLLYNKIRTKYQTKNTVGYSLNAFIDYEQPLDIFAHLLIGGEGTLAFITEASLHVIADKPFKATAMLYFDNIYDACNSIIPLKLADAEALELMDRASLKSVEHLKGLPVFFKELPETCAAILCEFQAETKEGLAILMEKAGPTLQQLQLLYPASFTNNPIEREFYWKIRKGMFPSVGAVRQSGSTVILEDIAFPVENLATALLDLQALFSEYHYDNAIIFGHAKDGNIHFVVTQLLDTEAEVNRYDKFLRAVVHLVVDKYNGTLKAEHGTGRNMAPFIEAEWGNDALAIMTALKEAADPHNILNPGVIINKSSNAHIENLKDLPSIEEVVDKCIECGYCEHVCPSKNITMTPRRRIVARRQLKRLQQQKKVSEYQSLLKAYQYQGLDTCATDGLCATECPVYINTGTLVKQLRSENHSAAQNKLANFIARHFNKVEKTAKASISSISFIDRKTKIPTTISKSLHKVANTIPVWMQEVGSVAKWQGNDTPNPDVIYFSSCINRIMGHEHQPKSLQKTILNLCKKAGINILLSEKINGHCCGQPFSSKGFNEAARIIEDKTINLLYHLSDKGRIPVMIDFTSCTYTLLQNQEAFHSDTLTKFRQLTLIDSIEFLNNMVAPKLTIHQKKNKVTLHPTCSTTKLLLTQHLKNLAALCASEVYIPEHAGCCGMAGDRGFLVPQLVASATAAEVADIKKQSHCDGYYSTATTCEMAMKKHAEKDFEHIAYLLDEVTI
ncbi:FAD-binding and (Fe-S)-binding domain-containing protein [Polluticaenibacter yanchengensis]|uniref:D-lactate dehydrogenase (cytochrome) n=1 Tax=Polluticaenibacter yanchengensis TaxID=3014562 RepID=A0ABT4UHL2_9BACT|nr:FAD-binding and (Fe-S)-binding domain-containing protein [Chitinophagaceae bacterium LY-5]